jgi:hypothetical protein
MYNLEAPLVCVCVCVSVSQFGLTCVWNVWIIEVPLYIGFNLVQWANQ